jgi:hypothetical protein
MTKDILGYENPFGRNVEKSNTRCPYDSGKSYKKKTVFVFNLPWKEQTNSSSHHWFIFAEFQSDLHSPHLAASPG